jgi:23S rRNA (guanine2445-N2)-methyltransferase / 23S rRNA (guanine2069-N7)-methyltransferase
MTAASPEYTLFAPAPKGLADLLATELRELGAANVQERTAGVNFTGTLETAYRACLWSRIANRILLHVHGFTGTTPEELYAGVHSIDWQQHITAGRTLACEFTTALSPLTHTHYGALKAKDAIVDRLRETTGERPNVDTEAPDLLVHVHAARDRITVYIDLAGESLHRRGYRERGVAAPLKENLAAGILLRSGWREIAVAGGAFIDPMCGSGTLPIEAALIAHDIAPGLLRERFGFHGWHGHDEALWARVRAEAIARREQAVPPVPFIVGYDHEPSAVRFALQNLERAGLRGKVHVERRDIALLDCQGAATGLVCANPPYGERLGEEGALEPLYRTLGERLRSQCRGWQAAVFTGNPRLGRALGLRARRTHTLYNGPIECRLLRFEVNERSFDLPREEQEGTLLRDAAAARARPGAQMFANRLTKNRDALASWARKEGVSSYRVYDADMPEYAFAIDLYQGAGASGRWLVVQEYAAPKSIDERAIRQRRDEAMSVLPEVLGVDLARVQFRTRRRSRGGEQYEKRDDEGRFHVIEEGGLKFRVNFTDYLDTGLFLDHRPTRALLRELAPGRRFLNLFAYTGTATVYAAAGGARATTTIDMSRTYLDWARANLELNGFSGPLHQLVQADAVRWLEEQSAAGERGPRYGLIFLDPPTFSNSKRMSDVLDVQRDHARLIAQASNLLTPDGVLIFSTNYERFRLDAAGLPGLETQDLSAQSIPKDFQRSPRIHQTWRITRAAPATSANRSSAR